jgi:hypothetical protein
VVDAPTDHLGAVLSDPLGDQSIDEREILSLNRVGTGTVMGPSYVA